VFVNIYIYIYRSKKKSKGLIHHSERIGLEGCVAPLSRLCDRWAAPSSSQLHGPWDVVLEEQESILPKKLEPDDLMDGKHQAAKASGHFANASVIHFQSPALSTD
jgi:hypothetical protein